MAQKRGMNTRSKAAAVGPSLHPSRKGLGKTKPAAPAGRRSSRRGRDVGGPARDGSPSPGTGAADAVEPDHSGGAKETVDAAVDKASEVSVQHASGEAAIVQRATRSGGRTATGLGVPRDASTSGPKVGGQPPQPGKRGRSPEDLDSGDEVGARSSIGYFACKGQSTSSTTSLTDLGVSLGDGKHLHEVLDGLPVRQHNVIEALEAKYAESFPIWRFMLREGFGLLLYGFGSKRRLLEKFATTTLVDGGVLVVNGFLPTTTVKQVISSCASALMRRKASEGRGNSPAALLEQMQELPADPCLYVVLHNIDGPALRGRESQDLLSRLAQCPPLKIAASFDHVDAPLMWDKQTAARFNWLWHDTTTYAPYVAETAHLPPMLLGRKDERTAKGAVMVLRSLTFKAREVFRQLADNQDSDDNKEQGAVSQEDIQHQMLKPSIDASGLPFHRWFKLCRERFLVTSELLLRTHLTEFKDHELVRTRRGADGTDLFYIPMDSATLERVLKEMSEDS